MWILGPGGMRCNQAGPVAGAGWASNLAAAGGDGRPVPARGPRDVTRVGPRPRPWCKEGRDPSLARAEGRGEVGAMAVTAV